MGADSKPDPRLSPWRDDLAASHLRGEVKASKYVDGEPYCVSAPVTALRRSPADAAMMDTQLLFGEGFRVYEKRGNWAWGQSLTDDYVGYVLSGDLQPYYETDHIVRVPRSFVYREPDIKSRPIMAISMGARLHVTKQNGRFSYIEDGGQDEATGWIISTHISSEGDYAEDYVAIAEMFLHTPYLWGGRESLGLDCSALVQLSLMQAGYACQRDTYMQEATLGQEIKEGFERGDLVFWKGHVGILQSAHQLLHANASFMQTVSEDFDNACQRIKKTDGPITSIRRLSHSAIGV